MKNEKMIIIYGSYGNKYVHVFRNVCDAGILLNNYKDKGLQLSWTTENFPKRRDLFYNLKPDEGFDIWDYDEVTYNRIQKEIEERR